MLDAANDNVQFNPCPQCKLNCSEGTDCISCDKCFNWYHYTCAKLTKKDFNDFCNNPRKKFICSLCLTKKSCHHCGKSYTSRSLRVNCVNCENTFCSKCVPLVSGKNIRHFLSAQHTFYCHDCDESYSCLKCEKPCQDLADSDPSIFCNCCLKWIHFKCSSLKAKQFNKLGRSSDSYFCSKCIGENLPFSKISKKMFNSDISTNIAQKQKNAPNCQLCIKCNTDCDVCVKCPNLHRTCLNCTKCSLLDMESFSALVNSKNQGEVVLTHINARSLTKNIEKIREILETLDTLPDIICISETKLNDDSCKKVNDKISLEDIQLEEYNFLHNNSKTYFGGTGIYILKKYSYTERNDLNFNVSGEYEASFVEMNLVNSIVQTKRIVIGSIYRHPHDNHDEFYDTFYETICKIDDASAIILAGDINVDVSVQSTLSHKYQNIILSSGLQNLVNNQFTRVTSETETTIDHILTNLGDEIIEAGVVQVEIADHLPVFVQINMSLEKTKSFITGTVENLYRRFFSISKKDKFCETFVKHIENVNFYENNQNILNPDYALDKLVSIIQCTYEKVFPLRKLSKRKMKKKRKPWLNYQILEMIKSKHKLYKKYLNNKTPENLSIYRNKRNKIKREVEEAKKQ